MRWEFTIRKSDEVRVYHETKSDGVRIHLEKERWGEFSMRKRAKGREFTIRKSNGVRVHHEKKRDGVRIHHGKKSDG